MKLTEIACKNAKPKEKPYKMADGGGLFLLVKPNGSKYWRLRFGFAGQEKTLALGVYPDVSLAEARDKRADSRKLIKNGIDPATKKKEEKRLSKYNSDNSFQSVTEEWYNLNKKKWTPRYAANLWRRLELHIFPHIGKRAIAEVEALELLDTIRKIEKKGATELSHRLLQTCNLIFRYAIVTKRVKYNPAQDLQGALQPHREEHHPTIKAKELPGFLAKLEKVETSVINKLAVKMVMLTFVPQGELRYAKWSDIDFEAKEWRVRAETTKMRELHIVPLAKQAIALLHELKKITQDSEYLFPSQQRRKNPVMSENTINKVIQNMGYKGKMVGHGFRALASTILNEHGFEKDHIERQLAHSERNKVRAAYNRAEYLPQRRQMMQWWANYVDGVVDHDSNVVQMRLKKTTSTL